MSDMGEVRAKRQRAPRKLSSDDISEFSDNVISDEEIEKLVKNMKGVKGNKKGRLVRLYNLLYSKTDENHTIGTKQIIRYFAAMGMAVNRKTVKDDVDTLIDAGYKIHVIKTSQNRYYMEEREFQVPEVKLLMDAVVASQVISAEKTTELIEKLSGLMSNSQAAGLTEQMFIDYRRKPANEDIYKNVDIIYTAIAKGNKIAFQYYDYNVDKQVELKHNGYVYSVSPYVLLWNDDHYYVVGYSDKHESISQFRIDRMYAAQVIDEASVAKPADFKATDYTKKAFGMMNGDSTVKVKLECQEGRMKDIVDRFGLGVETKPMSHNRFEVKTEVFLSPAFYSWIFGYGGEIKIKSPKKVVEEYRSMLTKALE